MGKEATFCQCSEAISCPRPRGQREVAPHLKPHASPQDKLLPHLCGNFLGAYTQTCLAPPGPPGHLPKSSIADPKLS